MSFNFVGHSDQASTSCDKREMRSAIEGDMVASKNAGRECAGDLSRRASGDKYHHGVDCLDQRPEPGARASAHADAGRTTFFHGRSFPPRMRRSAGPSPRYGDWLLEQTSRVATCGRIVELAWFSVASARARLLGSAHFGNAREIMGWPCDMCKRLAKSTCSTRPNIQTAFPPRTTQPIDHRPHRAAIDSPPVMPTDLRLGSRKPLSVSSAKRAGASLRRPLLLEQTLPRRSPLQSRL